MSQTQTQWRWKILAGAKFHNGKGTVREVIEVQEGDSRQARNRMVQWKRVQGSAGRTEGTAAWSSFIGWAKAEWLEPRPDRLPVPHMTDVNTAFPTGKSTPPWRWVPDEFRDHPGHGKALNPWCVCISKLWWSKRQWTEWHAVPKEGVDPDLAHRAILETLGSWDIKHERKMSTAAYMMSEWFEDFWWEGASHTVVNKHTLSEWIEGWEG